MKKIVTFLIIVLIIIGAGFGIYQWQKGEKGGKDEKYSEGSEETAFATYSNSKYGFSLEYPADWYFTGGPESETIEFRNLKEESGEGGLPLGANIGIYISENYENFSLDEWIDLMMTEGPGLTLRDRGEITVGKERAIKLEFMPILIDSDEGLPISVYLAKNNYIIQINYIGREPDYSGNLVNFEHLLNSFKFE